MNQDGEPVTGLMSYQDTGLDTGVIEDIPASSGMIVYDHGRDGRQW